MENNNYQRRNFLKSLLGLSVFSMIPFKITAFNNLQDCITTPDIEGPYYIPNSPNISILTPPEISSDFLFITGTVYANDCNTPIPNATVDVWHSNKGVYDSATNSYLNSSYDNTLYRAKIFTDENGNYAYQTVLPVKYLNGNYYRPSHIHYKASYNNQNELTTQLYFENDTSIPIDPWASSSSAENRIISLETDKNNNLHGVFDIVLNTNPLSLNNIELNNQKLIQSIYPNPVNEHTYIYLKSTQYKKTVEFCDISGKSIYKTTVFENKINLHKTLNYRLKKGIYIIKISSNDIFDAKRICVQ